MQAHDIQSTPQAYPPEAYAGTPGYPAPQAQASEEQVEHEHPVVIVYSHSSLFYWWPVWVAGYVMAGISFWGGDSFKVGTDDVLFYPDSNLGVIFFLVTFLVILITNVAVRGLASALVIVTGILITVVLAWFDIWDSIFNWIGNLKIHLNLGAYFWFSTLLLIIWLLTVFVFDRMSYWRFKPGQATKEHVFGAASKSYDTENLVLEKYRDDIFRHWILGLGSGDLHIRPYGAQREEFVVPNVLFIGSKIHAIQHLIATEPQRPAHPDL